MGARTMLRIVYGYIIKIYHLNDQIFKKSYMIFAEITIKVKLAIDVLFSAFGWINQFSHMGAYKVLDG